MRAGAVPVGAYDSAVGHRVFAAGGCRQVNEQALPHACFEPTAEPGVDVLPRRRPRMRTCPDILPGPSDRGGSIVADTAGGFERPERRLAVVTAQTRPRLAAARVRSSVRSSVRPLAWPAITCAAHPFAEVCVCACTSRPMAPVRHPDRRRTHSATDLPSSASTSACIGWATIFYGL